MQKVFALHELAVEDAQHGHQRPKIEEYGDSLFAVLHTIELVNGELNVGELNIFVEEKYVLSVRNRGQQGFLGVRERCEREPQLLKQGAAFVFYALMDAVVDRYFPVVDFLDSELEIIEQQIFVKGSERANIERLYQLKQQVTSMIICIASTLRSIRSATRSVLRYRSICRWWLLRKVKSASDLPHGPRSLLWRPHFSVYGV
jgi:magnesium transporter